MDNRLETLRFPLITASVALAVVFSVFWLSSEGDEEFRCDDLPFRNLKRPIIDLESRIIFDIGTAKSAVIIRLVDSSRKECFFAILKNLETGEYDIVLEIPQVPMSGEQFITARKKRQLPGDLYVDSPDFRRIPDQSNAKRDLIEVLKDGSEIDDFASSSLEYLRGTH